MINYYFYALLYSPILIFIIMFIVMLRDNRIHCYIINRNHEVRRKKVNPNLDHFRERNSIYMIPSECVTLSSTERGMNPKSELYYVEDNPLPVNFAPPEDGTDPNVWAANKMVLEMVLRNTGKTKNEFVSFIVGYVSEPSKLLQLVFVLIIISALLAPRYAPELIGGVIQ